MKIFVLGSASSTHTINWINGLAILGHEITLAYAASDDKLIDSVHPSISKLQLKYKASVGYYLNTIQVRNYYKKGNFDVAFIHYLSGYGTLANLANIHPAIISVYGSDIFEFPFRSPYHMCQTRKNLNYADIVLSSSYIMKEKIQEIIPDCEVHVISFGIDLHLFNSQIFPIKIDNDSIVIGTIKSLEPIYAIDDLIKSIDLLRTMLPNETFNKVRVLIYGSGSQYNALQGLINTLDLTNTIYLKGSIDHSKVPKVLSNMDIFCATSLTESFGVSVLEAMAMGLPIVVTDCPGFVEITHNGEIGKLVERGNHEQIARAIKDLIDNPELRLCQSQDNHNYVKNNYSFEESIDELNHILTLFM